jgi:hypothetical protein
LQHDDEAKREAGRQVEPLFRRPVRLHLDTGDLEIEIDLLFLGGTAEDDIVDKGLAAIDEEGFVRLNRLEPGRAIP